MHKNTLGEFRKDIELMLVDNRGSQVWLQHPTQGQEIDVAVLPLPRIDPSVDLKAYCANEQGNESLLAVSVGTDVFLVGFPKGLALQEILPIWKRGTVATEFEVPIGGLPAFLVDSATREGMSGSPVYARSAGSNLMEDGSVTFGPGTHTRFLGVYSGRYGAEDEFSIQLGRVWHREVLDEIIASGVPGSFELR